MVRRNGAPSSSFRLPLLLSFLGLLLLVACLISYVFTFFLQLKNHRKCCKEEQSLPSSWMIYKFPCLPPDIHSALRGAHACLSTVDVEVGQSCLHFSGEALGTGTEPARCIRMAVAGRWMLECLRTYGQCQNASLVRGEAIADSPDGLELAVYDFFWPVALLTDFGDLELVAWSLGRTTMFRFVTQTTSRHRAGLGSVFAKTDIHLRITTTIPVPLASKSITTSHRTVSSARLGSRHGTAASTRARSYRTMSKDEHATVKCNIEEYRSGDHVGTITISNPKKLNIVSTPLLAQIVERCKDLSADPSLRAVVLTGGETAPGKAPAFIGGADINEMHRISSSDEARQFITCIHLACKALRDLPVPVIARVDGYALGAGLEIMAACDLRIAIRTSKFAMPEVKVGIPSVVEAALLPGLIGMGRTRRLLYLAENIDASQAETWGLVDRVVSNTEDLDSAVRDWVGKICDAGPNAIKEQKRLMQVWEDCSTSDGVAAGIDSFANAYKDGGVEPKKYMGKFLKSKI
jgi:enoyl-CoA hydratase/carnithine racemase